MMDLERIKMSAVRDGEYTVSPRSYVLVLFQLQIMFIMLVNVLDEKYQKHFGTCLTSFAIILNSRLMFSKTGNKNITVGDSALSSIF